MKLKRTIKCGELRKNQIGNEVVVNGWVHRKRLLGGLIFIDLRDVSGIVQIVLNPEENQKLHEESSSLRSEDVIAVKGKVVERESPNDSIPTGYIEIIAGEIETFNKSDVPPFSIEEHRSNASEELRLKYRYLDLRRDVMRDNLIMKSKATQLCRNYLYENNFIDIDTPTLFKSTPEGARDFLVPSRLNKGKFYALPQSPQIMKQLLMIAGFDRYFQFARCYRDEDLRLDRQYEFVQLDIEMSFIDMDDIINHTEIMVSNMMKELYDYEVKTPFPRITFSESMERFGNDKPDMRFGMELKDITEMASKSDFKVFSGSANEGGKVAGLCVEGKAGEFSRKNIEELQKKIEPYGAKGLAWLKYEGDKLSGGISKFIKDNELSVLKDKFNLKNGDLLLFVADRNRKVVYDSLANLRLILGKMLNLYDTDERYFVWITHAPMFEYDEEEKRYVAIHHPFTMPNPDELDKLETEPDKVTSLSYDLVLNGFEIAGGSIRIHNRDVQGRVFKQLGLTEETMNSQFGFLLEAFKYGAPPHGGIAFGFERMMMILQRAESIRDVIAFPKTTSGICPLSSAPSEVSQNQLEELKLQLKKKNDEL
jgi:aspartyl-tRNA synthetase